jgi:predicted ATP-grasp superfamily ATP-dependent carboligase
MLVFVSEYLCGGAGGGDSSLEAEGWAMLAAALADFGRCPGVETATVLAPALAAGHGRGLASRVRVAGSEADEERAFRDLCSAADWTLVVAPEFGGLLARRCGLVEEEGGRLLGPSAASVRLAGDKLDLARHFLASGVPTPPCVLYEPGVATPFPAVVKPRTGAGSVATFLVRGAAELARCGAAAAAEGWDDELIAQAYVPGRPASVAFLLGPARARALPPAAQELSEDGRFRYRGGGLPLPPELAARAERVARRAVEAVPGLAGYVGVDVVLGEDADGSGDAVIEVNPRLTTSYVGLRALARFNLAAALLAVAEGREPPPMSWYPGPVRFTAAGVIQPGC